MAECSLVPLSVAWLEEFEREQSSQRLHWSTVAWNRIVEQSLPALVAALESVPDAETQAVLLRGYLTLVAEALGLQLLFPHPHGEFPNLYCAVLEHVIPLQLGTVSSPKAKAEAMTMLWNLCDAASREPAWVESALIASLLELETLDGLQEACRTMQQALTQPAPQVIKPEIDPSVLAYKPVSVWPLGFFLPERVMHCGPNVFLISGQSPGIARSFYVLAGSRVRVIPLSSGTEEELSPAAIEPWTKKLLANIVQFPLAVRSLSIGESSMAIAFSGSQLIHLWQVKS